MRVPQAIGDNGRAMTIERPAPRRPRHLLDPDNLRPAAPDPVRLTRVQQWVMSVLAGTVITLHGSGIVAAAYFMHNTRPGTREGLLVIAGMFGMLAVGVARMIHKRSPLSPWLVAGWLLPAIGAVLIWH